MEPLSGRMDFEFETMSGDLVGEIERRVNEEIAADREIRVATLPREEAFSIPDLIRTKINLLPEGITEVRTIEIVGLDLQADGGTHVARTVRDRRVKVTGYESKGRINKRIRIEVGDADGFQPELAALAAPASTRRGARQPARSQIAPGGRRELRRSPPPLAPDEPRAACGTNYRPRAGRVPPRGCATRRRRCAPTLPCLGTSR